MPVIVETSHLHQSRSKEQLPLLIYRQTPAVRISKEAETSYTNLSTDKEQRS